MYHNNLKRLRNEKELTQEEISLKLGCNRSTYNNWERGIVMIPLNILDQLSLFYKVTISYILGMDKKIEYKPMLEKMDYNILLENLCELKRKNKNSYTDIARYLKCARSTCQRYFNGVIKIPIDRLILLAEFYDINLDKLCGKL